MGSCIQSRLIRPAAGEGLDWWRSIDPPHHVRGPIGDVLGSASGVQTGLLGNVEAGRAVRVLRCLLHETLTPAAASSRVIRLVVVKSAIDIACESKRAGEP